MKKIREYNLETHIEKKHSILLKDRSFEGVHNMNGFHVI